MKTYEPVNVGVMKYRPLSFDSLKEQLVDELFEQWEVNPETHPELVKVANSAASVAWETPYPFLFLPTLLEESVRGALDRDSTQQAAVLEEEPVSFAV